MIVHKQTLAIRRVLGLLRLYQTVCKTSRKFLQTTQNTEFVTCQKCLAIINKATETERPKLKNEKKMNDIKKIEKILQSVGVEVFPERILEVNLGGCWRIVADIPNDLNAIRELELLVIEKVGAGHYWESLMTAANRNVLVIATADAKTRIAAMLAALEGLE
jgi:hypothetical protein